MKIKKIDLLIGLVFVAGLAIMLYPTISDLISDYNQSKVVDTYVEQVSSMTEELYKEEKEKAIQYNTLISKYDNINEAYHEESTFANLKYDDLLDPGGIGIMGILKIPTINVELPIYHGTEQEELQIGVGHYRGSSLPIGGESTHSVLTGHTGLPSSRLLTDMDQLEEGDIFYVQVLKETLAYEVDQIKTVLPEEMDYINVVEGSDYCTLVTCTPYGINSHRLLVRGKRISYVDITNQFKNEIQILPLFIAIFIAILLYIIVSLINTKIRKKG